jgi:hypothetical protein
MMSRASQVIILCEDKLHEVFVRRFLKLYGYTNRDLSVPSYPASGRGSGESFVRRSDPDELRAYRSRSATTFLIAVIDADKGSVADREDDLRGACTEKSVEPRQDGELVIHVVPKRAINTWLAYLDSVAVDEETDYSNGQYSFRGRESETDGLIKRLHAMCRKAELPQDAPSSLRDACGEFARIKDHLRSR